jgi:hypothetical protein
MAVVYDPVKKVCVKWENFTFYRYSWIFSPEELFNEDEVLVAYELFAQQYVVNLDRDVRMKAKEAYEKVANTNAADVDKESNVQGNQSMRGSTSKVQENVGPENLRRSARVTKPVVDTPVITTMETQSNKKSTRKRSPTSNKSEKKRLSKKAKYEDNDEQQDNPSSYEENDKGIFALKTNGKDNTGNVPAQLELQQQTQQQQQRQQQEQQQHQIQQKHEHQEELREVKSHVEKLDKIIEVC